MGLPTDLGAGGVESKLKLAFVRFSAWCRRCKKHHNVSSFPREHFVSFPEIHAKAIDVSHLCEWLMMETLDFGQPWLAPLRRLGCSRAAPKPAFASSGGGMDTCA